MSDHYLIGAETVERAASSMHRAAESLSQAGLNIEGSLDRFLRQFEGLIERLEAAVAPPLGGPWTHACNALCVNSLELWVARCPHCGKPKSSEEGA